MKAPEDDGRILNGVHRAGSKKQKDRMPSASTSGWPCRRGARASPHESAQACWGRWRS